jgi:hypothetical protein
VDRPAPDGGRRSSGRPLRPGTRGYLRPSAGTSAARAPRARTDLSRRARRVLATRVGLASVDLDLPPARVDLRTYGHDLELTSLVLELEREFGPDRVRTEREMRASDTSPGRPAGQRPSFAVSLTGARGQLQLTPAGYPRLHFPRLCGDRREDRGRPIARGRARAHGQGASAPAPHPRRLRRGQAHRIGPLLRARRPRPESS